MAAAKPLKGRFVHLTDMHPDPNYRYGTAESRACHFKKKRHYKHDEGEGAGSEEEDGDSEAEGAGGEGENVDWIDDDSTTGMTAARANAQRSTQNKHKDRHRKRKAGYWGLPVSECDSPLALVNATFDWLAEHFRDEVDFVIWTGDNARHDIDSRLPRTLPEILNLNRYVADRIRQTFGKGVVVVPSIGNNDLLPHNIMFPGPNRITSAYLDVWSHFIPEHAQHLFARFGAFSVEAIKGDLLLVSLNTIYFYDRNAAVDGCPPVDDEFLRRSSSSSSDDDYASPPAHLDPQLSPTSPRAAALFTEYMTELDHRRRASRLGADLIANDVDPGTEQLLWLEQQLTLARAQGMQVWLTGHVPATKENWYPRCLEQYAELMLSYQDTIVGQLFGHMNVDFVSFLTDADTSSSSSRAANASLAPVGGGMYRPLANDLTLLAGLEKMYSSLPPKHKLKERDYVPIHVNPSVIPTYVPSVRIWEYNTTRSARDETVRRVRSGQDGDDLPDQVGFFARWTPPFMRPRRADTSSERLSKRHPNRHSSRHSPSRSNSYLTPLAYTQYHIPHHELERANKAAKRVLKAGNDTSSIEPPSWSIEYTTLSTSEAAARLLAAVSSAKKNGTKDPVLLPALLPQPLQTLLASPPSAAKLHRVRRMLRKLDLTPYNGVMSAREGLTVGAWIRMAKWVSEKGKDRWKGFRYRMGAGSGEL
ncbi:hypothetical protein JCM10908_004955 [Rhodotorula pacifica]|uniref:uncharacterized protein n=1 Tax=Rhodotorula pacifica TaxID=1495444 RepID=UPI00316C3433